MVPRMSVNCSRMNLTFSRSVRSRVCAFVSLALLEEGVLAMAEILTVSPSTGSGQANFSGRILVSKEVTGRVMKLLKLLSVLVALVGVALLVLVAAPSVHGQRAESP